MKALGWFLAWEWINIAIEYTASSWVRLPRWILAVIVVNLATHPVFTFVARNFGRTLSFILPCELVIIIVEAFLLMALYGFGRWRILFLVSFAMNAVSCATGLLLQ